MATLVVQIPCFNEEASIYAMVTRVRETLNLCQEELELDRAPLILVIDDGSTDNSVSEATRAGADKIVQLKQNQGLAIAFQSGLKNALELGATIIVHIDADGQYSPTDLPALIKPVREAAADLSLGVRPVASLPQFSWLKQRLQVLGSALISWSSGVPVKDATTGFRCMNRKSALRMHFQTRFTFTLESLFIARENDLRVCSVEVTANPVERPSRLARGKWQYILKSLFTVPVMILLYRPLPFFLTLAAICVAPALTLGLRNVYFHVTGDNGHIQSTILAATLIIVGTSLALFGFLAEILAGNRRVHAAMFTQLKKLELENNNHQ